MNESEVSTEQVRREHLAAVKQWVQATYLVSVIIGAFVLMLILMAMLGSASG
jgi:hypothetical protein